MHMIRKDNPGGDGRGVPARTRRTALRNMSVYVTNSRERGRRFTVKVSPEPDCADNPHTGNMPELSERRNAPLFRPTIAEDALNALKPIAAAPD